MHNQNKLALLLVSSIFILLQSCAPSSPQAGEDSPDGSGAGGEPFLPFSDIGSIGLLTTTSGVGAKPLFEWQPVDGAVRYSLHLQFPDGRPYWAWSGTRTSVYLGGSPEPPAEDTAGPILLEGMAWAVVAFDSNDNIIATSILQAISP